MRVQLGRVTIAESRRTARVLETSHPPSFYIPKEDIDLARLSRAGGGSRCEWKGQATYWDVIANGAKEAAGAWSYETPFGEFEAITGHVSFYPARFDCFVDDDPVEPQQGGFYGGWITRELAGPFKGGPGSSGW